jgi:hypothetical protein
MRVRVLEFQDCHHPQRCALTSLAYSLVVHCSLQARSLDVQELQCQAWGGSADALEASALSLLELDPDFITVSRYKRVLTAMLLCNSQCH